MRAGAIAAGLVAVALAASSGLVFAQKGSLTALPGQVGARGRKHRQQGRGTGRSSAQPAQRDHAHR